MSSETRSIELSKISLFSPLLFGVLLIGSNLRASITSVGPVLDQVKNSFLLSNFSAGMLNALPLLIFALASPFSPWLIKKIGIERSLAYSLILIFIGCLLRSYAGFSGLWIGTSAIGIGIAIANVLVVPLVKRDFPEHTALCVGLYAATMAFMAAVASGIASPLSSFSSSGWKLSLSVWSILALIALVVWIPNLKNSGSTQASTKVVTKKINMWKNPIAWQVSMFMALQTMVFYTLIDWFPSIVKPSGISEHTAGLYLFVYQAIAVVANIITSVVIKRVKDQRLLGLICSAAIMVGVLGLMISPHYSLIWLISAGIGAGMSMVTCLTLFGLRTTNHHQAGALSGMAQCVGYGLGAAGPFFAGNLHDYSGGWTVPLTCLVIASLFQMGFSYMAGRDKNI